MQSKSKIRAKRFTDIVTFDLQSLQPSKVNVYHSQFTEEENENQWGLENTYFNAGAFSGMCGKIPPVVNMLWRRSYTLLCAPEMIAATTHKLFKTSSSPWLRCYSSNIKYCLSKILLKTSKFICTSKCGPFTYFPQHQFCMYIWVHLSYMHVHIYAHTHTHHPNAFTHTRGTHTLWNVYILQSKWRNQWMDVHI